MNNAEVLKDRDILVRVITKAINNGWKVHVPGYAPLVKDKEALTEQSWRDIFGFMEQENYMDWFFYTHDFAKAFWGEAEICADCEAPADENYEGGICRSCADRASHDDQLGEMDVQRAWYYHLQQIVIHPDPIEYLERFI